VGKNYITKKSALDNCTKATAGFPGTNNMCSTLSGLTLHRENCFLLNLFTKTYQNCQFVNTGHRFYPENFSAKNRSCDDQAVEKTDEEYVTSAEDAVVPAASMNNQPEKMDVDSETADEKAPKSVVEIKKEDEIENDEEEFIKEDAPIADAEPGVELSEAVAPAEIDDDVHLEADNIRKELLDELIAEAEKPNQEKSVVQPEENATTEALAPALDSAVTEEDDLVPATQLSTDQMEVDDPEAEKPAKNNDDARTTDKKETAEDKPNKSGDAAEKATTESAKAAEGTTSGEAASVDKVKSLISEWGDDDEDEDENGVSAAAKEEL